MEGNPLPERPVLEAFVRRKIVTSGAIGKAPSPSHIASVILEVFDEETVIRDFDVPDSDTRALFYKLHTWGILKPDTVKTERQGKPWDMHHWVLQFDGGNGGVHR